MGMFVDYQYYQDQFGGALSEQDFTAAARKAEAYIRYLTFLNGDIFADTAHMDAIKAAVCAAAEARHGAEQETAEGGGGLKSESKDGLSVSFIVSRKDGETADEYAKRCMYQAIREYLLPTGWLSRKVRCGCDHECGCCDHL